MHFHLQHRTSTIACTRNSEALCASVIHPHRHVALTHISALTFASTDQMHPRKLYRAAHTNDEPQERAHRAHHIPLCGSAKAAWSLVLNTSFGSSGLSPAKLNCAVRYRRLRPKRAHWAHTLHNRITWSALQFALHLSHGIPNKHRSAVWVRSLPVATHFGVTPRRDTVHGELPALP